MINLEISLNLDDGWDRSAENVKNVFPCYFSAAKECCYSQIEKELSPTKEKIINTSNVQHFFGCHIAPQKKRYTIEELWKQVFFFLHSFFLFSRNSIHLTLSAPEYIRKKKMFSMIDETILLTRNWIVKCRQVTNDMRHFSKFLENWYVHRVKKKWLKELSRSSMQSD